jgi:hypothetical protein
MAEGDAEKILVDLKTRLEKLIVHYDLFFREQLKIEPLREREEFARLLGRAQQSHMSRTEHLFRLRQIGASFHTHCDLWDRKMKHLLQK